MEKSIQIRKRNTDNTGWDNLFPITKLENINDLAYFYADTNWVTANSAELTQLSITSKDIIRNKNFTLGTNEMLFQKDGIYYIDILCEASGLNSDVVAEIIIRRYENATVYGDTGFPLRGAMGQGGNSGGVIINGSMLIDGRVGGKLQFFFRPFEGPRMARAKIKCFKVASLG